MFDLYLKDSVKGYERLRRNNVDRIETIIQRYDKPLPVDTERFSASGKNEINLQIMLINWLIDDYKSRLPLYLGGSHQSDLNMCMCLQNGVATDFPDLKCFHEEADDRIMYHINHAAKIDSFSKVIVASGDTDVFISLLYHYTDWKTANLVELWILCGQGNNSRAVPCIIALNICHWE